MLNNNLYNVMMQLVQENTALWRIKNEYLKDAEGDEKLTAMWDRLAAEKVAHIEELQGLVAEYSN